MYRNMLNWLVSSGSFVLVLLTTYSAQALPVPIQTTQTFNLQSVAPLINLNQANSRLNLTPHNRDNPILHALGCSCGACTQGWDQS